MSLAEKVVGLLQQSREGIVLKDAHSRILNAKDTEDLAAAICTEIGQTMLPRSLTFRGAKNSELVVDAGGRRLFKVKSFHPDTLAANSPELMAERRDEPHATVQTEAIGALVAAFIRAAEGEVRVSSTLLGRKYGAGAIGFPPEKLLAAAVAALKKFEPESPIPVVRTAANSIEGEEPTTIRMPTSQADGVIPAGTLVKRVDPTSAMRELIRQKTEAAAAASDAIARPSLVAKPGATADEAALMSFFDAVKENVALCALLNSAGNIESIGGVGLFEGILDLNQEFKQVIDSWVNMTVPMLSRAQLIILRAGGIQNHSICCFTNRAGVALAVFVNTDLSRIFGLAERLVGARRS